MPTTLTPGRYRGLNATSNDENVFNILAFDQRGSYRKMLPDDTDYETAVQIKIDVIGTLSKVVSAVLLDNFYGLSPALHMSGRCGLLMTIEESGYSGDSTYRQLMFDDNWSIAKIKRMGASAVKLMAYYHPDTGELAEDIERQIVEVAKECHKYDLPLFLEPMSYSLEASIKKESAAYAKTRPDVVIETARRLSGLGADVLKLEFPADAAFEDDRALWQSTCEKVSEVSSIPWVLLSAGVDYEVFSEQAKIACQAGASGWLAGRSIWKETATMPQEERLKFLKSTATDRAKALTEVANKYARPWTEFYVPQPVESDWYKSYETM